MTIAVDMGRKATKTKTKLSKEVGLNGPILYSCKLKHSAILLTFIKLPFVIKIFVLSFFSGYLRHVLL